jgi:hypothetical protein
MNKYAGLENVAWILVVIGIADLVLVLIDFFFRLGLIPVVSTFIVGVVFLVAGNCLFMYITWRRRRANH